MDNQDVVQGRLREIMRMGQAGAEQLGELLHRQHYNFAHKLIPYIIGEHFDELISGLANNSAQQWICRIWKDSGDAALVNYSVAVYPTCQFVKASDEIGVVYFVMPAPRTTTEALYMTIVFLMDRGSPSTWLWRYFTLELGSLLISSPYLKVSMEDGDSSVRWTFAEWDNYKHINRGEFKFEPTLNNFLSTAVAEAQSDWY
jgi:hypothetical protein